MNIPTIRATDTPRVEELARDWVIIITARFPSPVCPIAIGYLGRLSNSTDGPNDLLRLDDPFDYQAVTEVDGAGKNARARRVRQISPVDGLTVKAIAIAIGPGVTITRLSDLEAKAIASIRNDLIGAWDARAYMRRQSGGALISEPGAPTGT